MITGKVIEFGLWGSFLLGLCCILCCENKSTLGHSLRNSPEFQIASALADSLEKEGQLDSSLHILDALMLHVDSAGTAEDRAYVNGLLGKHYLYRRGRINEAQEYLVRQRDILEARKKQDTVALARNYIDLSFLHIKRLELPFAKSYARMAQAMANQKIPTNSLLITEAYIALGHVLWYGLEEERPLALHCYHTARQYLPDSNEKHVLSNKILVGLINIFNNVPEPDSATYYLDQYHTLNQQNRDALADYYRLYGICYYITDEYAQSAGQLEKAAVLYSSQLLPDPFSSIDAYFVLSAAYQNNHQFTKALSSVDSALIRKFRSVDDLHSFKSDISSIGLYAGRAEVLADSAIFHNDTSLALSVLEMYSSIDTLRRHFIKLDIDTYLHQQFYDNYYYAKRMEIYAFLFRSTRNEKWLYQIHDVITTYKAQGLNRDKILNQLYHSPAGQNPSFRSFVQNDLALEEATRQADYTKINLLLRNRQEIIIQMHHDIPEDIDKLINTLNISAQDVLDYSIKHETAVINYYIGNPYYNENHIYVLTAAQGKFFLEILDQSSDILTLAGTLYKMHKLAASSPSVFDTIGYYELNHRLYRKLFASTSGSLKEIPSLILIPDQKLHFVSFEGLVTNDPTSYRHQADSVVAYAKYLIQDFNITYAYSPNDLLEEEAALKADHTLDLFAMAFSSRETLGEVDVLQDVQELNSSYRELQSLEQLHSDKKSRYFYGYDCTKENFLRYADEAEIIHISTHGAYDPEDRTSSVLYLRNKQGIEKLYPHEIRYRDIHPRLIVLSACDSGAGKASNEEGMFSIGRTFQAFGAEEVISALWPLSGNASAEFCELLYRNLLQQQDAATALRNVKLKMSLKHGRYALPGYWSALVMHN